MNDLPDWTPRRPCRFMDALRVIYEAILERYCYFFPSATRESLDEQLGMTFPALPVSCANVKHYMIELVRVVLTLIKYSPDTRQFGTFADQIRPFYYYGEAELKELFDEYGFDYDEFDLYYHRIYYYRKVPKLVGDWHWVETMCKVLNNLCLFAAPWWLSPVGGTDISGESDGCYIHCHFREKIFDESNRLTVDRSGVDNRGVSCSAGGNYRTVASWDWYYDTDYNLRFRKIKKYDAFFKNYHAGQFINSWQIKLANPMVYQRSSPEDEKYTFNDYYPSLIIDVNGDESEKFNAPGNYDTLINEITTLPNSTKNDYRARWLLWLTDGVSFKIDWENIPDLPYRYFDRQIFDHIYQKP